MKGVACQATMMLHSLTYNYTEIYIVTLNLYFCKSVSLPPLLCNRLTQKFQNYEVRKSACLAWKSFIQRYALLFIL